MPNLPNEDTERWVRFWVRSVREDSSVRKLKRADRCIFYEYIALARWQSTPPRLRGCLCDGDGRAWTRAERAAAIGEKYATTKRAEEAMEAAGLITFHESAASHHSSRGRLRIVNYDRYQGGINDPESAFKSEGMRAEQPSNLKATASKSEGYSGKQPSNLKAGSAEETASESEGNTAETSSAATDCGDGSSQKTAFKSEGNAPIEVNDIEVLQEKHPECFNDLGEDTRPFWAEFQSLNVGGMPDTARQIVRPQLRRTPIDLAVDAAVAVVAKRQGRRFDWRELAEHCVNLMQTKTERRRREEAAGTVTAKPSPRSSYEAALAEVEALANAKFADLPEPAPMVAEGGARDE